MTTAIRKSRILDEMHQTAHGLHGAGLISKRRLGEFWPPSTRCTASCLNSRVYRARLVAFVISVLLAWIRTLSKGYVFRGQGQYEEIRAGYLRVSPNPSRPGRLDAATTP